MSNSSVTLDWASFWAYWNVSPIEEKISTLQQLQLTDMMKALSWKHQVDVLKYAPQGLIDSLKPVLHVDARYELSTSNHETVAQVSTRTSVKLSF